jgi:putative membrane protein
MKRVKLIIKFMFFGIVMLSCNDNKETTTEETTTVDTSHQTMDTTSIATSSVTMPLAKEDSSFILEASMGGRMEVEFANYAQTRAKNQRVKDFAAMMIRDHSQANQELKNFAASRNFAFGDTIGHKNEGHLKKLLTPGINFDKTYMQLMVNDHKEDVSKFEKAAGEVKDPQLKSWVEKTLPVLKVHRDSAVSINKAKL